MPDASIASDGLSAKAKARVQKDHEKWEAEYARARRIKIRSRATLIVCPLSTVVNWEDQFKEHWAGEVQVVGGAGVPLSGSQTCLSQIAPGSTCGGPYADPLGSCHKPNETPRPGSSSDFPSTSTTAARKSKRGNPLKVYVYHGNARCPDPKLLADFDAVITTYATLASEYSKQTRSITVQDADEDDGEESGEGYNEGMVEVDEMGNQIIRLPKAKKGNKRKKNAAFFSGVVEASSPLQSIHWFRVVLDEAQ